MPAECVCTVCLVYTVCLSGQVVAFADEARTCMARLPRECTAAVALAARHGARREAELEILNRVVGQVPSTLSHPATLPHPPLHPPNRSSAPLPSAHLPIYPPTHPSCAGPPREASQDARRAASRSGRWQRGGGSAWGGGWGVGRSPDSAQSGYAPGDDPRP